MSDTPETIFEIVFPFGFATNDFVFNTEYEWVDDKALEQKVMALRAELLEEKPDAWPEHFIKLLDEKLDKVERDTFIKGFNEHKNTYDGFSLSQFR